MDYVYDRFQSLTGSVNHRLMSLSTVEEVHTSRKLFYRLQRQCFLVAALVSFLFPQRNGRTKIFEWNHIRFPEKIGGRMIPSRILRSAVDAKVIERLLRRA